MKKELKRSETLIWMETPYRLIKILDELIELKIKRHIFLACDLGGESELLLRGPVEHVRQKFSDQIKKEFVLLLAPL
jgi:16S rRNA C1402 (ribose-2'-O) methylase RsmI